MKKSSSKACREIQDIKALVEFIRNNEDSEKVGEAVANFYKIAEQENLEWLFIKITENLCEKNNPLFLTGVNLAQYMDLHKSSNPYHNNQHAKKVMINSLVLASIADKGTNGSTYGQPLTNQEKLELLFASLTHDLHHDGTENNGTIFRLENIAIDGAKPFLEKHNVSNDVCERIFFMVRWTDLNPLARKELQATDLYEKVEKIAKILSDADILASLGLTAEQALIETKNLSEERSKAGGISIDAEAYKRFTDFVLDKSNSLSSAPAKFFTPNILDITQKVPHFLPRSVSLSPAHVISSNFDLVK